MEAILQRRRWLALALLALCFAFGLFDHSLWSANDAREGAMIREMYREGVWITPVFNGRHYLEKPPLLHWTALLLCHAFGAVNEGLVRLPAALYGFGAALIIWLWAGRLGRAAAGMAAAFMCATSLLYFEYSKIVLTDAALTFMVMLALYLFWRAWERGGRWFAYLPFVLASAAAFYAKGLIGPGLVWVAVSAFLLYRRQWKRWLGLGALFVPAAAVLIAPWLAGLWLAGGEHFLRSFLWDNQFGRFFVFSDTALPADPYFIHKEPWYFYLIHVWERLVPWTLLAAAALVYWFRRRGAPLAMPMMFLRFALAAMFLVLQLSSAKADCYLLPLFPLIFLMTGIWLEDAAARWDSAVERWLVRVTVAALGLAALAAPLAYLGLCLAQSGLVWIPCRPAVFLGLGLALLALGFAVGAGCVLWRSYGAGRRAQALLNIPPAAAVLFILNAGAFIPALDYQRSYEPFAALVRREMRDGRRIALAGGRERDCGAFMFYLDARLPAVALDDGSACAGFLDPRAGPAGIIVSQQDLGRVARRLEGRNRQVLRCPQSGYKSAGFRLVINAACEAAP